MSKKGWTPDETVIRIKQMAIAGKGIPDIHRETGVNKSTICCILTKRYRSSVHVDGEENLPSRKKSGASHHLAKLNDEKVSEILRRIAMGEMSKVIALEMGISETTVSGIKHGYLWPHIKREEYIPKQLNPSALRIDGRTVYFSTGRTKQACGGIIGIDPTGNVHSGSDECFHDDYDEFGDRCDIQGDYYLTDVECVELADYMLAQWEKFKKLHTV